MGGRNDQKSRKRKLFAVRAVVASIVMTRRIGLIAANHLVPNPDITARNKCDTNSDTCCLGKNFVILEHTRITADVYAYDKSLKPMEGVSVL